MHDPTSCPKDPPRPFIPPVADDLLLQGRHAEAIPYLENHVREDPRDLGRWALLLMTYDYCKMGKGAVDAAQRLVIALPEDPDSWNMAGEMEGRYGDPRLAIRLFKQAINLNGGSASTWKNLGVLYSTAGREDLALKAMHRSFALDSTDPDVLEILIAHSYEGTGPKRVVHLCKALLQLDPRNSVAWERLGHRRLEKKQYSRAIIAFEKVLVNEPGNPRVLPNLAHCHFCLEQYREAKKYYEQYLRLNPSDAAIWVKVGSCHLLLGNPVEGRTCVERALQLDPTNASAISLLDILHH